MNQRMKILIAYDGSSYADAALDDLRRAGLPDEVEALVTTVAEGLLPSDVEAGFTGGLVTARALSTGQLMLAQVQANAEEVEANLTRAAERLRTSFPRWQVTSERLRGAPAEALIQRADEGGAELLVVGSQGRSALGRLLFGSVSQKIMTEARCSVRVARGNIREPEAPVRVIVGVDGSVHSDAAVDEVARRAWPEGSVVKVVSVVRLPFTPTEETRSLPDSEYSQLEKAETAKAQTAINGAVARLKQSGITPPEIESEIILGDAREKILDEAARWEADLIVLGSRGLGGFKRFLLGSVAQGVAAYAPCSVEIVRSRQTDGAGQQA